MSDDTFIREVNEEIRQERVRSFWSRFGWLVITFVVVAILGTIGYVLWERHRASVAAADGDRYLAAIEMADNGDLAGATEGFEALASDGVGAYPHLARLRLAGALEASGDLSGAVTALDEVTDASGAPRGLRDVAAVRAAYILVDTGTPDDVRQRVERLTGESEPLRHQAREALGLSLWKAGDGEAAQPFFEQLTSDAGAPSGMPQRARLILDLIAAGTVLPSADTLEAAPPITAAPAAETPPAAPDAAEVPAEADVVPPAETADEVLSTPLADQLDLPDADAAPADAPEAPAGQAAPADEVEGTPAVPETQTPAEPSAPAEPQAPGATPPS
ncbi:tetratricopeptide repeat protein [Aureimonas mangrovi]|uniref:tetratricopeptide repeat protein n=1 Tax=Aureimonas mangrovi TaxID=2758041 RepID=UPI00163DBE78|nr:tetratricopeptide repeat protein [Aureimonas mangrovi]